MGAKELRWDFTLSHLPTTRNKNFQDRIRAVKTISIQSLFITHVHYMYSVLPHPYNLSIFCCSVFYTFYPCWIIMNSLKVTKLLNQMIKAILLQGKCESWLRRQAAFLVPKSKGVFPEETIQLVPGLCSRALTQTWVLTHGKRSYWRGRQAQTPREKGPTFP